MSPAHCGIARVKATSFYYVEENGNNGMEIRLHYFTFKEKRGSTGSSGPPRNRYKIPLPPKKLKNNSDFNGDIDEMPDTYYEI